MDLSDTNIQTLEQYFRAKQESIVAFTRELVEEESPSRDESGSKAVVALLAGRAAEIGGLQIERLTGEGFGEHLRVTAFGESLRSKPIVILGHTDTVHPRGSLAERPWRVDDGKAYGPGVFDMKVGCALALEVMRFFVEGKGLTQHPIVLLLTCDEETGTPTGRPLVEAAARNAHAVLVLEPPATGGRVKTGRKGTGFFTLEAHGRAAHAGLEPEKGASAILELARQTDRLHSWNGSMGGISLNVGVFNGGTLSNVVSAEARAEIDVRFKTVDEAVQVEDAIRNLKPFDERVQLSIHGGINRPPLDRNDKVLTLYEKAKVIAKRLNFDLGETQVGGASDGNFAAAVGAAVLDGLGVNGEGAHATHEHILLEDIARRGALIAGLIASLGQSPV